jgi:hypothetical protein
MTTPVVYDAGALIAAERGSRAMWAFHRRLLERDVQPAVPAVALAQAWRGPRQVQLARLLRSCALIPFTERDARIAGVALARSGTDDVVDAGVVVAAGRNGAILTSDPGDLRTIADAMGSQAKLRLVS